MGLRCLLGHDFGEPELERERQEEGSEVVVSIREVKTCTRCGEQQVVSENTEVTSLQQFEAADGPAAAERESAADDDEGTIIDGDTGVGDVGAEADAADSAADAPGQAVEGDGAAESEATDVTHPAADDLDDDFEPPQTAEEDDGIILDDDGEEAEPPRERGQWPDADVSAAAADADEPTEASPWPEQAGEDEGYSASMPDGEAADVEFGNKLAPELDEAEEGYDAEFIDSASDESAGQSGTDGQGGFARAETVSVERDDVPTEYYCPACEMTADSNRSSLRAGDICPECRSGYLTERER